jgi:hypothetical protein
MRTPRSSATRRRPRASSAGWTVAAPRSSTPRRWTGEPVRRADLVGREALERVDAVRLAQAHDAVPDADVRRRAWPSTGSPRGRSGSRSRCARANSPDLPHRVRRPHGASRTASSSPQIFARLDSFGHQLSTMPPLRRPDAPPPQTSCSSDDDVAGRVVLLEPDRVHRPTKPPPAIATSARAAPSSGGAGFRRLGQRLASHSERWGSTARDASRCGALGLASDAAPHRQPAVAGQ